MLHCTIHLSNPLELGYVEPLMRWMALAGPIASKASLSSTLHFAVKDVPPDLRHQIIHVLNVVHGHERPPQGLLRLHQVVEVRQGVVAACVALARGVNRFVNLAVPTALHVHTAVAAQQSACTRETKSNHHRHQ